jgi:hypothetical protein
MECVRVVALALCSMLTGLALGIRFRFVILLPIIAVGAALLTAISAIRGGALSQTVAAIVVFASLLQLGYICTALFRHVVSRSTSASGRQC